MALAKVRKIEPQRIPLQPSSKHLCPLCGGEAYRVRRRLVDRITSVWRPIERYHCYMPRCNWEGNLIAKPKVARLGER